ncbi:hypothetical protein KP78_09880 [Jeotgalibacillus soli]|uniref:Uncharacterized protein n=1 Tax=Jeotgalibacillus soli TaxID=889306 RepID=A0A0C2RHA1_9BACL|nr:hypothetical protein KP78_09880 [Jeotgalibacillus soli]
MFLKNEAKRGRAAVDEVLPYTTEASVRVVRTGVVIPY